MTDRPKSDPPSPAEPATGEAGARAQGEPADLLDAEVEAPEPREDDPMRALLKRSMARDMENAPHLLAGVQRRIRTRSRGKFFADGWSTTQARVSYALVGLVTLLLIVLAYLALGPMDIR
jgi:hypothetical protein